MLITENYIYIELQKRGCSHTRKILMDIPSFNGDHWGIHNSFYNTPDEFLKEIEFEQKIKIGNIRNPWAWYVSLWAFGCMKQGGLYSKLVDKKNYSFKNKIKKPLLFFQNATLWKKLYSDSNNEKHFRRWLWLLLSNRSTPVVEGFNRYPISTFAGLLTFRFLRLYTYNKDIEIKEIKNLGQLEDFYKLKNFMDIIIKNENIEKELLLNANVFGTTDVILNEVFEKFKKKSNASKHKKYESYYDLKTMQLVAKREKFLIDMFQYQF